jgi:hypothetical protein
MFKLPDVCSYESLHLLIADQQEDFRPPARSVLPPHCTKDVYTPQGSTCDLWTVRVLLCDTQMQIAIREIKADIAGFSVFGL